MDALQDRVDLVDLVNPCKNCEHDRSDHSRIYFQGVWQYGHCWGEDSSGCICMMYEAHDYSGSGGGMDGNGSR